MNRPSIEAPKGTVRLYESRDRDAVIALEKLQNGRFEGKGVSLPMSDPADPQWACCVVVEDEDGKIVAAIGGRRVIELGSTFDAERFSPHEWRDVLLPAWVKIGVALFRQGYEEVFCRVTSPTPAWGNTLVKRGGFFRSRAPHYYFDLKEADQRSKKGSE